MDSEKNRPWFCATVALIVFMVCVTLYSCQESRYAYELESAKMSVTPKVLEIGASVPQNKLPNKDSSTSK